MITILNLFRACKGPGLGPAQKDPGAGRRHGDHDPEARPRGGRLQGRGVQGQHQEPPGQQRHPQSDEAREDGFGVFRIILLLLLSL